MITTNLIKPKSLNTDPRAIQQSNFTANLDRAGNTITNILEEAADIVLDFWQGTVKGI